MNLAIFIVAAAVLWPAGARLARYADEIAERTRLGASLAGLVILAGVTSMPEIVTTVTAVRLDEPRLALNNLYGGMTLQTAMLAFADAAVAGVTLTFVAPRAVLLIEGAALIAIIGLSLAAMSAGDTTLVGHVGLWSMAIALAYVVMLLLIRGYEPRQAWRPVDQPDRPPRAEGASGPRRPMVRVLLALAVVSVVVLASGVAVLLTAEAMADDAGISTSFIGATLVALATSLPELSTTVSAVRLGSYELAIANIFGSNALMAALVLVADATYPAGAILSEADPSARLAASLGIVVTAIYLIGLIGRRRRTYGRLGYDSWAVLAVTALGIVLLHGAS